MKGGRMRLKEHEIASIKRCAERHFGPNCAVRLFGSRADDARRGGDVDLHVQVDDDALSTMACRIRYLSDLEAALGGRKVDLVVEGPARTHRPRSSRIRSASVSPAESAVESLHSALADAHHAAVDVATAAGVLVADYLVTPTECAGFGTEKPSLAAGGGPKSRSQVRSVAPADANRWPADRHDRCARPWLRHSRDTQSGETAAVRPPWHHLAAPRHTSPADCRSA